MAYYQGNHIELLHANTAYSRGYLTFDEYFDTEQFEQVLNAKGLYVPKLVFVNGVYKGITREEEMCNWVKTCERLRIITYPW